MNLPNFTIRLLTLLSYFLPFIFFLSTCTDQVTSKDAFNKVDAIQNEKEKLVYSFECLDSLMSRLDDTTKPSLSEIHDFVEREHSSSSKIAMLNTDFQYRLLMPTEFSLSGIGAIFFHKNLLGKVTICISLVLSLIILVFYRFLERRRIAFKIISVNIIVLVIFIADNLLSDVTMLFGTWTLLFLLLNQLRIARENKTLT